MILSDEYGTPVVVDTHSPANAYVNKLKSIGFYWVVLPRLMWLGLTTDPNCDTMVSHTPRPTAMPHVECTDVDAWRLLEIRAQECASEA